MSKERKQVIDKVMKAAEQKQQSSVPLEQKIKERKAAELLKIQARAAEQKKQERIKQKNSVPWVGPMISQQEIRSQIMAYISQTKMPDFNLNKEVEKTLSYAYQAGVKANNKTATQQSMKDNIKKLSGYIVACIREGNTPSVVLTEGMVEAFKMGFKKK